MVTRKQTKVLVKGIVKKATKVDFQRFTDEAHLTRGYLTGLFREVWLNSWWPDKDASIGADAAK